MKDYERMTSTAIRYALYDEKRGGYIAKKNTHNGCTDFYLVDSELEPKIFKTPEQALTATSGNGFAWYH